MPSIRVSRASGYPTSNAYFLVFRSAATQTPRLPMALAGAGHGAGGPSARQEGRRRHHQDKERPLGRLGGKVALISGGAPGHAPPQPHTLFPPIAQIAFRHIPHPPPPPL